MCICKNEHRYDNLFKDLPESQGSDGRHKCAGCAYDFGQQHKKEGKISDYDSIVHLLPYS